MADSKKQEGVEELRKKLEARKAAQAAGNSTDGRSTPSVDRRPAASGKMKICKVCGKRVAKSAKKCPGCGAKLTMAVWKKACIVVAVLVVLSALGKALPDRNPGTSGPSGEPQPPQAATISYEPYNVADLFNELHSNALKAERTYKDKYVDLYGYLSNIDSDGKYISIGDGGSFSLDSVRCHIQNDAQLDKVMELTKGDPVVVRGKITLVGEVMGYSMDVDDLAYAEAQPSAKEPVGDSAEAQPSAKEPAGDSAETAPEAVSVPGVGDLGDYHVEVQGAVLAEDYKGNPAIVVTYRWTNNSEETRSAMVALNGSAFQDGIGLETAIIGKSDVHDGSAYMTEIRPGASLDVSLAYVLKNTSSVVEFELSEFVSLSNKVVSIEFDPGTLQAG